MFTWHITTNVQTLCRSKTSPSFSGAHSSCISRPINTIFVPQIGMYIRVNMSKTDFFYRKILCDSVTFCQGDIFLTHPVLNAKLHDICCNDNMLLGSWSERLSGEDGTYIRCGVLSENRKSMVVLQNDIVWLVFHSWVVFVGRCHGIDRVIDFHLKDFT